MNDTVILNMRSRAAHCRLLAKSLTDELAARSLRSMADEIEGDIERLQQGNDATRIK